MNSDHHGAGNHVILIWNPIHVGERFAHFNRNTISGSWVIRDYITGWFLSNATSPLTIAQIEQETVRDAFPPFHQYTHNDDWNAFLRLMSLAFSKQNGVPYSVTAPLPIAGWQRI